MQAVDDGATLDVHRIDGDLIRVCCDGCNPIDDVVQSISLAHERRLEHQVGFHAQTGLFEVGHRAIIGSYAEPFVDVEAQYFVIVGFEADGHSEG